MHFRSRFINGLAALVLAACATTGPDSVRDAEQVNASGGTRVSKDAAVFLVEMVDARLMDFEEGKLAAERGTRADVRDYGQLMMKDQTRLLAQLNALAAESGVAVPNTIGAAKRDGLKDLLKTDGEKFDKAFISSIRIDHERDVGEFRKATKFSDLAVARFATETLPLIESHLAGIKQIDKTS